MITTIAALYVILPALYALACVALTMRPVVFDSPANEASSPANEAVYSVARDHYARKAITALRMAQVQHTDAARNMWLDVANVYRRHAEACNAAIAA